MRPRSTRSPTWVAGSAGRALLLVISWRSEAVPPGHRLRRLALDLVREGRAAIVSPARLDEGEVATLVEAARPGDAGPDLARRVYVESEGLPLFVAEYLAALRAGGDPAEDSLPTEVRSVLDARLGGLGDVARQVLGAAAAIGRSFDLDTVRQASGRSEEETVARSRSSSRRAWCGKLRDRSPTMTSRTRSSARWSTSRPAWPDAACSTAGRRPRCRAGARARRVRRSSRAPAPGRRLRGRSASSYRARRRSMRRRCTRTPTRSSISRRRSRWATRTPADCTSASATCAHCCGDYGGALASYESAGRLVRAAGARNDRAQARATCTTAAANGSWRRRACSPRSTRPPQRSAGCGRAYRPTSP